MRRILSICVLIITMCLTIGTCYGWSSDYIKQMVNNEDYSDITDTSWAYDSVKAMSQKGIVRGYPDGSFRPQGTLTYGEFIKMTLIAETGGDVGNSKTGNWALNYYNKALELNYFSHNEIKANQLNRAITRSDMALIMSNIIGETKIENYERLENSLSDINSNDINSYDIIKVYSLGIITGYQDGRFKPENTLTRAESATVIYRLVDESKRVMPKEKKEDVIAEDKTSGTDIASVIKNYKTYEGISEKNASDSNFMEATSYEFVTEMSEYKVSLGENRGTKWIDINGRPPLELGWGNMYLMKNNEIIQMTLDGIYDDENRMKEHIDINTIEYFVFPRYKKVDYVIGIMPNPLYKNK